MPKINLKIKNGSTTETVQHEIEALSIFQLQATLKHLKKILDEVNADEGLRGMFLELMEEESDVPADEKLVEFLMTSFDFLLVKMPDEIIKLLATMSGIELNVLGSQKAEDLFDVYDAILEVNDVERLLERAKKSSAVTKSRTAFLRKRREATAPTAAPVQ